MRRCALLAAVALALAVAAPAASQHGGDHATPAIADIAATARVTFNDVLPRRLDVVAGEAVRWTNDSARVHTVTADDDSFDSGRMFVSQTYTHRFRDVGTAPYHCSLHPLIQGVVDVHDLLLEPPSQAAVPQRPFPFAGRSALPPGTPVTIEADSGSGFAPAATAEVADDGRFGARIVASQTATYRAVAGTATSPPVRLLVLGRRISIDMQRGRGEVRVAAKVTPPSSGGRIVLQLYLPERFGWWPAQRAKPGRSSRATFTVRTRRNLRARVRYTLADGATALATSRTVRVGPHPAVHAHR